MKKRKLLFAAWSCNNPKYYAYSTWNTPLRNIFQEVISFDPQEETYRYGKEIMNKKFIEIIKLEKPDYVFLWLIYEEFYIDTLLKIKEISPKTKIINYCGDDDILFSTYSIFYSLFIDYFFVTHPEFIPKYLNKAFLSQATNTEIFKPLDVKKKYDVTFIGTPKGNRISFMKYLIDNGIKVRVFGSGWNNFPEFKDHYGGFIDLENFAKVINQTRVNICFTKNYEGSSHINQHPFEVAACNAISLVENSPGFLKLYKKDKEIITFSSQEELLEKVKYYLSHQEEGKKISHAAYERTIKDLSKTKEFEKIFKQIFSDEKKIPNNLQKLKEKAFPLSEKDLLIKVDELIKKLKDYGYVYFKTKNGKSLKYKKYFSILALKYSRKQICCSDYYVYSNKIGDYLALYIYLAFKKLNEKQFRSLLILDQMMVTKEFFLNNIEKFKEFFSGSKINIINEKNTAFITIPLARTNKIPNIDFETIKKIIWSKFEINIKSLIHQKKIFTDPYLFHLITEYLKGNTFVLKYLAEKLMSKTKPEIITYFLKLKN